MTVLIVIISLSNLRMYFFRTGKPAFIASILFFSFVRSFLTNSKFDAIYVDVFFVMWFLILSFS